MAATQAESERLFLEEQLLVFGQRSEPVARDALFSSTRWISGSRIIVQVVQFFSSIVIARLLEPRDFGLMAIIFSITAFANLFAELGCYSAIVQRKHLDQDFLSTVFWFTSGVGALITLLVVGLAWPIAQAYGEPRLTLLLITTSFVFTLNLGGIQTALLERNLRFKKLAIIEAGGGLLGIGVSIATAALGAGAYSLAVGPIVQFVVVSAILWAVVPWRPAMRATRGDLDEAWRFGRGILGFNVINYWTRNIDNVALGAIVTPTMLGFYSRAYNLMTIPVFQMATVLSRVLFPALTQVWGNRPDARALWLRALRVAVLVTAPIALLSATAAPALIKTLYGSKWNGSIVLLEILAVAAIPQLIAAPLAAVYQASGETGRLFKIGGIQSALTICIMLIGLPWGTRGVCWAVLIDAWVALPVGFSYGLKLLDLTLREVGRALWPIAFAAVALTTSSLAIRFAFENHESSWLLLATQVGYGIVTYLAAIRLLDQDLYQLVVGRGTRIIGIMIKRRAR
jgi:O-antigen/teichoic acid export membrane protein